MNCLTRVKDELIFINFQIFHLKDKNTNHLKKTNVRKVLYRKVLKLRKQFLSDYANYIFFKRRATSLAAHPKRIYWLI